MSVDDEKAAKRATAKERLIWSQRLGMYVDKDTGRPVLERPGDSVRVAIGMDYDPLDYERQRVLF